MASTRLILTETKIKALAGEPGAKQTWFFDERSEGLALVVTATGSKVFYYKKWVGDGKVEKKIGKFDASASQSLDFKSDPLSVVYNNATLGLEDARAVARAITGALSAGTNPFKEKQRHAQKVLTVSCVFDIYESDHLEGKRKRASEARADFLRDCQPVFGSLSLDAITGVDARAWHKNLTINRGPYTANRRVQLMRALYNKAIKWKLFMGENPFADVALNPERERENTITEKQLSALWNELEHSGNSLIRDFGRLLLLTGARKSELCRMRWDCLDLDAGRWLIPDSKNGEGRTVALGDLEIRILRERRTGGEWVFASPDGKMHLKDPKKAWDTARRNAGVPGFTIHDARRQLGTMLARSGADLKVIQKALGHKDLKTTLKHYRVASEDDQRRAKAATAAKWLQSAADSRIDSQGRVE